MRSWKASAECVFFIKTAKNANKTEIIKECEKFSNEKIKEFMMKTQSGYLLNPIAYKTVKLILPTVISDIGIDIKSILQSTSNEDNLELITTTTTKTTTTTTTTETTTTTTTTETTTTTTTTIFRPLKLYFGCICQKCYIICV